jgi:hypothetical protein
MSKYGNIRTEYKGRKYDSKAEAARAYELDLLHRAGEVIYWTPQPTFKLAGVTYRADFLVQDATGRLWIEDVKGVETAKFKAVKTLWVTSGPRLDLKILKRKGRRWEITTVPGNPAL